jgi:hypothetical protein
LYEKDVTRHNAGSAVRLFNEPQLTQREFTPEFRNFAVSRKR